MILKGDLEVGTTLPMHVCMVPQVSCSMPASQCQQLTCLASKTAVIKGHWLTACVTVFVSSHFTVLYLPRHGYYTETVTLNSADNDARRLWQRHCLGRYRTVKCEVLHALHHCFADTHTEVRMHSWYHTCKVIVLTACHARRLLKRDPQRMQCAQCTWSSRASGKTQCASCCDQQQCSTIEHSCWQIC